MRINGKQSEIKIKLKPDILGEMSLKIIAEKGIVTAKAMVESYQVKELIESNLDQLKDELNEQGIDIQEFEVSVGKDSNFEERAYSSWRQAQIKKGKFNNIKNTDDTLEAIETMDKLNPYLAVEGSIDLMA
ncbi:Flagellar hook-length control protein FliK [Caldisalinibacter kiritimatiensis]|uniref:Flagellar hook-length control protein FliK n=2 Tax=Caldisalinibacter kiritimatiensis TaxID=1304284 RepID=R1ARC1_9FIRM|nr:Flagellar hook-length control protein FliK [Caldisalinibacter kiritimatiensis]